MRMRHFVGVRRVKTMSKYGGVSQMTRHRPIVLMCKKAEASNFCFVSFGSAQQKVEDMPVPNGAMTAYFYCPADKSYQPGRL